MPRFAESFSIWSGWTGPQLYSPDDGAGDRRGEDRLAGVGSTMGAEKLVS